MDILQTVNQAKATTDISGIDSPTITKREIETSVVVQNGETIALGGLIKESNDYSRFGVPVLHEIPLFGSLFGSTSRNKDKTELVVLLTPRVMKSRQDAQDVTEEFKRKLSGIYVEPVELNISN
jgi:general secretion pathway protein D